MRFREFHNGLRILRSIDMYELIEAGVMDDSSAMRDLVWSRFRLDPYTFFIGADDDTAAKIWTIIEKRMS